MRYLLIFAFVVVALSVSAQRQPENQPSAPSSLDPGRDPFHEREVKFLNKKQRSKKQKDGSHIETYDEYVKRMKSTAKAIAKNERLMQKPQYSNPLYFGHKRPPKKHKAGKLKFCKECGIRH